MSNSPSPSLSFHETCRQSLSVPRFDGSQDESSIPFASWLKIANGSMVQNLPGTIGSHGSSQSPQKPLNV